MGLVNDLFEKILDRKATTEEENRFSKTDKIEIIKELSSCREKYGLLYKKAGDFVKTRVSYDDKDIEDFFSNKELKIAVCLSGHLRDYETNLSNIEKFLVKPLNADVFIHTWDTLGKQKTLTSGRIGPIPDESKKYDTDILNMLSNIKAKRIESNSEYLKNISSSLDKKEFHLYGQKLNSQTFGGQAEPKYIYSQFYSIYQSYKLLEKYSEDNNIKYDVVIKLRSDYILTSGIQSEDFDFIKDDKNIFIPSLPYSNHGHPSCCLCKHGIDHEEAGHLEDVCDVFAYGSQETMKKYMSVYEHLDEIREKFIELNDQLIKNNSSYKVIVNNNFKLINIWDGINYTLNCFYPERIFRYYLKNNNLLPSRLSGMVLR